MMYYLIIKNDLNEWVTYTRKETQKECFQIKAQLAANGFKDERMKVVAALSTEVTISAGFIELTMSDGVVKCFPLHSTNLRGDFLSYVQMAMTNQLKEVVAVELQGLRHDTILYWCNERAAKIAKKAPSVAASVEIKAEQRHRQAIFRRLYA